METELPQLENLDVLNYVSENVKFAHELISEKYVERVKLSSSDLEKFNFFIDNSDAYVALGKSLVGFKKEVENFKDTISGNIKTINSSFKKMIKLSGKTSLEDTVESTEELKSNDLLEKYIIEHKKALPSSYNSLRNMISVYVTQINEALNSIKKPMGYNSGNNDSEIKLAFDFVNEIIKDSHSETSLIKLKILSDNLYSGLDTLNKSIKTYKNSVFNKFKIFYDSIKSLNDFSQGKEKVSFYIDTDPLVFESFKDPSKSFFKEKRLSFGFSANKNREYKGNKGNYTK